MFSVLLGKYVRVEFKSRYILKVGVFLIFLRNCRFFFHSCQPCVMILVLHPCQHLLLSVFLILAMVVGVWWYFIVALFCISLMINNVKHFFPIGLLSNYKVSDYSRKAYIFSDLLD